MQSVCDFQHTTAYDRASTDKRDLNNQEFETMKFAWQNNLKIDAFIEITFSSRKTSRQRQVDALLQRMADGDTLIYTEFSQQGRGTSEIIDLISELVQRNIHTIIIKQKLDVCKLADTWPDETGHIWGVRLRQGQQPLL